MSTKLMFVHRYKDGHAKKRRVFKKLFLDKDISIKHTLYNGWVYEVPSKMQIKY